MKLSARRRTVLSRLAALLAALLLHGLVLLFAPGGGGGEPLELGQEFRLAPSLRIRQTPVVPPVEVTVPEVNPEAPVVAVEEAPPEEKAEEPVREEPESVPEDTVAETGAEQTGQETDTGVGESAGSSPAAPGSGGGSGGGTGTGRAFWPVYKVDVRPALVREAPLHYPEAARRQNREGTVIVELDLTEDGSVEAWRVTRSAGYGFDEAAVEMLLASGFSPARAGGLAVAVRARFTINFRLED